MATATPKPTTRVSRTATIANLSAALARGVALRQSIKASAAQLAAERALPVATTEAEPGKPAEPGTAAPA